MNLAAAQSFAQDYIGAEATYQRVIGLLETEGKVGSSRMARATAGLAGVYSSEKRYQLAVPAYEHALTISRRSEGLFNEEQLPLLDGYAESLTEMGQLEDAYQAYLYGLRVAERRFGADSPQIVERLEELGRWYTRIGIYDPGRQYLRAAVRIVEKKQGVNSIALVGPLTAIAESFRRQLLDPVAMRDSADVDRNSVFHDAIEPAHAIARAGPARRRGRACAHARGADRRCASRKRPPLQVADVRTQMGDWYQTRLQHDRALPHYKLAWEAATHAPDVGGKSLRELLFGRPVLLHYVRSSEWDRYARRPADRGLRSQRRDRADRQRRGTRTRPQARVERRRRTHGRGSARSSRHRPLSAAVRRRCAGRDDRRAARAGLLRAGRAVARRRRCLEDRSGHDDRRATEDGRRSAALGYTEGRSPGLGAATCNVRAGAKARVHIQHIVRSANPTP
jgi:tetratricopeptide (TPR) repeat protein